jgi:hypothetical protein
MLYDYAARVLEGVPIALGDRQAVVKKLMLTIPS